MTVSGFVVVFALVLIYCLSSQGSSENCDTFSPTGHPVRRKII